MWVYFVYGFESVARIELVVGVSVVGLVSGSRIYGSISSMGLFGGWSVWLIESLGWCCWVCLVDRGLGWQWVAK